MVSFKSHKTRWEKDTGARVLAQALDLSKCTGRRGMLGSRLPFSKISLVAGRRGKKGAGVKTWRPVKRLSRSSGKK